MNTIRFALACLLLLLNTGKAQAVKIYVNASSTSMIADGRSWHTAYVHLQEALVTAQAGDEVWVAKGTFYPTNSNNRDTSFVIPQGVYLYGGFDGTETEREERNPNQRTILSGNIGHPDSLSDNSRTVIYASASWGVIGMDGIVVEQGYSDGVAADPRSGKKVNGGGLYVDGRDGDILVHLENCIFDTNEASFNGGAIFIRNTACDGAAIQFNNCSFIESKCGFGGGAISIDNRGNDSYPSFITNCSFVKSKSLFGGAIQIDDTNNCGSLIIRSSQFYDNYARVGGAISYDDNADGGVMLIDSCYFERNFAENLSGAIDVSAQDDFQAAFIRNSKFINNSCGIGISNGQGVGGAICIGGSNNRNDIKPRPRTIENCIFIGNKAKRGGALLTSNSETIIKNCLFVNNFSETIGGAYSIPNLRGMNEYNIINCTFVGNIAEGGGAISAIKYFQDDGERNTLNLTNCIFQGNKAEVDDNVLMRHFNTLFRNCLIADTTSCEVIVDTFESYEDFYSWSCFANVYDQDPLFRDSTNADFRLFGCSPAVDVGSNIDDPRIDLDGNSRQLGTRVDMGTYEFIHEDVLPLNAEFEVVNANNGGTLGALNIIEISGGYPPYVYQIVQDEEVFDLFSLLVGDYELQIIDSEKCMAVFPFRIEMISNTEEKQSLSSVSISPNPSQIDEEVFLHFDTPVLSTISIFDETGRVLDRSMVNRSNHLLFLPSIPGIYFIRVVNENSTLTKKVLRIECKR